jgi:hypothetical protein
LNNYTREINRWHALIKRPQRDGSRIDANDTRQSSFRPVDQVRQARAQHTEQRHSKRCKYVTIPERAACDEVAGQRRF